MLTLRGSADSAPLKDVSKWMNVLLVRLRVLRNFARSIEVFIPFITCRKADYVYGSVGFYVCCAKNSRRCSPESQRPRTRTSGLVRRSSLLTITSLSAGTQHLESLH